MSFRDRFLEEGFATGLSGIGAAEARRFRERLETIIRANGGRAWRDRGCPPSRTVHPLREWMDELAHHPAIADAVATVLGDDLLLRNHDIVVRGKRTLFGPPTWHRDSKFDGPRVDRMLTAWIALTPATKLNGCMRFVPRSHRLAPEPLRAWNLIGRLRARTDRELRNVGRVPFGVQVWNVLDEGQMSLHHPRTIHGSGSNVTGRDRIAFVMRFMADDVDPEVAEAGEALLVRGRHRNPRIRLLDGAPMQWAG
jgi:ectoine hydroxylase-related dioxygenase (phytanoyl-CoA dioxygenase family)